LQKALSLAQVRGHAQASRIVISDGAIAPPSATVAPGGDVEWANSAETLHGTKTYSFGGVKVDWRPAECLLPRDIVGRVCGQDCQVRLKIGPMARASSSEAFLC